MKVILSLVGLAFWSGTSVFAAAGVVRAETIFGRSGQVQAEISYEQTQDLYKNVHLKILRSGKIVFDDKVPQESEYDRPIGSLFNEDNQENGNRLPVVDLDGDKEPEVIADFFTGGAHCCIYSLIYRYDKQANRYNNIRHDWGNGGYRLKDLDKDGLPEFESRDDRFAYAFTSYAASGYPLQIWQYRQGKMIDVTRRYPKLVQIHAQQLWQTYRELRHKGDDGKGFLAAYLADKYLLNQGQDGWKKLQQNYKERDRAQFFAEVRKFLRRTGYIKVR
jgi:hypothetical protein